MVGLDTQLEPRDPRGAARTEFTVEPLTANCRGIYRRGGHVLIGVSPGNRYFSVGLLTELFRWAGAHFQRVDAIVPDAPLRHNYQALGYPEARAISKSRTEVHNVLGRIRRAWAASGVPAARRHTHLLSEFVEDATYQRVHRTVRAALEGDQRFGLTASRMVRGFLRRQLGAEPDLAQVGHARHYLSAELPFLLGSAEIFQVPESLNFYHRPLPLARALFEPGSALRAGDKQGYAIVRPTGGDQ